MNGSLGDPDQRPDQQPDRQPGRSVRRTSSKSAAKDQQRERRLLGPGLSPAERLALSALVGAAPRADGSTHHGMIDDRLIEGMCNLVDRSPILDDLDAWRAAARKNNSGRPRAYARTDRLLIVLMLALLSANTAPQLKQVAHAVHHRLSTESRERLGLPSDNGRASERAIYGRIWRAWKDLTSLCDPLPGIDHRRRTRAEVQAIRAARDPDQSRLKALRAERILNAIVRLPLALLDPETIAEWRGDITLDATDAAVWGRNGHRGRADSPKPTDMMSPEFEAGRYHHHSGELVHAYAAHIALMAPDPLNPGRHPILALALAMDLPGSRNGLNALALLRSVRDAGHPARHVVADRAYGPGSRVEDFTRPARALGYTPVVEYTKTQLDIRAYQSGAIWIEGNWYCPSMPEHLANATKAYLEDKDLGTWVKRVEQRRNYIFPTKDGDDGEVKRCPAQGSSPTAMCTLRPSSMVSLGMPGRAKAVVLEPPVEPGRCCTNKHSVTLRNDVDDQVEKLSQDLPFGSRDWHAVYKPLRAVMEGFNGFSKDETHEGLAIPAHRRVRGFFANGLVTAITLAVSNIRLIKAWRLAGEPPAMRPNRWLDPETYKPKPEPARPAHHAAGAWWREEPPDAVPIGS